MAIKGNIVILTFAIFIASSETRSDSEEEIASESAPVIMQKVGEAKPEPINANSKDDVQSTAGIMSEGYSVSGSKQEEKNSGGTSGPNIYRNLKATPVISAKEQALLTPPEKYSGSFLDTHALAVAADCAPFDASGSQRAAVIPLGENFFVVPAKAGDLPPYPPNDGKDGIHGVDVNENCIRDDVEHYIFSEFPKKNQASIRSNLYAHAIWLNFFLLEPISDRTIQGVARQNIKTGGCVTTLLGEEPGRMARGDLFARMHNTVERTERYLANLDTLSGFTIEENITGVCL